MMAVTVGVVGAVVEGPVGESLEQLTSNNENARNR
jgi:hypothetical protein